MLNTFCRGPDTPAALRQYQLPSEKKNIFSYYPKGESPDPHMKPSDSSQLLPQLKSLSKISNTISENFNVPYK